MPCSCFGKPKDKKGGGAALLGNEEKYRPRDSRERDIPQGPSVGPLTASSIALSNPPTTTITQSKSQPLGAAPPTKTSNSSHSTPGAPPSTPLAPTPTTPGGGDARLRPEDDPDKASRRRDVVASFYSDQCELIGFKATGSRPPSSHDGGGPAATSSPATSSPSSTRSHGAVSRADLAGKRREFFRELAGDYDAYGRSRPTSRLTDPGSENTPRNSHYQEKLHHTLPPRSKIAASPFLQEETINRNSTLSSDRRSASFDESQPLLSLHSAITPEPQPKMYSQSILKKTPVEEHAPVRDIVDVEILKPEELELSVSERTKLLDNFVSNLARQVAASPKTPPKYSEEKRPSMSAPDSPIRPSDQPSSAPESPRKPFDPSTPIESPKSPEHTEISLSSESPHSVNLINVDVKTPEFDTVVLESHDINVNKVESPKVSVVIDETFVEENKNIVLESNVESIKTPEYEINTNVTSGIPEINAKITEIEVKPSIEASNGPEFEISSYVEPLESTDTFNEKIQSPEFEINSNVEPLESTDTFNEKIQSPELKLDMNIRSTESPELIMDVKTPETAEVVDFNIKESPVLFENVVVKTQDTILIPKPDDQSHQEQFSVSPTNAAMHEFLGNMCATESPVKVESPHVEDIMVAHESQSVESPIIIENTNPMEVDFSTTFTTSPVIIQETLKEQPKDPDYIEPDSSTQLFTVNGQVEEIPPHTIVETTRQFISSTSPDDEQQTSPQTIVETTRQFITCPTDGEAALINDNLENTQTIVETTRQFISGVPEDFQAGNKADFMDMAQQFLVSGSGEEIGDGQTTTVVKRTIISSSDPTEFEDFDEGSKQTIVQTTTRQFISSDNPDDEGTTTTTTTVENIDPQNLPSSMDGFFLTSIEEPESMMVKSTKTTTTTTTYSSGDKEPVSATQVEYSEVHNDGEISEPKLPDVPCFGVPPPPSCPPPPLPDEDSFREEDEEGKGNSTIPLTAGENEEALSTSSPVISPADQEVTQQYHQTDTPILNQHEIQFDKEPLPPAPPTPPELREQKATPTTIDQSEMKFDAEPLPPAPPTPPVNRGPEPVLQNNNNEVEQNSVPSSQLPHENHHNNHDEDLPVVAPPMSTSPSTMTCGVEISTSVNTNILNLEDDGLGSEIDDTNDLDGLDTEGKTIDRTTTASS